MVDIGIGLALLFGVVGEALAAAEHVGVQARVVERADGGRAANANRGITRVGYGEQVDEGTIVHHLGPLSDAGHVAATIHALADDGAA